MPSYNPTLDNVQTTIDNAQPGDIINLPNEVIPFSLRVVNQCSIRGKEGTVIDVDGNENYCLYAEGTPDISNIKIKNSKDDSKNGIILYEFSGDISGIEVDETNIGLSIEKSTDFTVSETKIYNSNTGLNVKNSYNGEFSVFEVFDCDVGYNIEGSSSIMGDIFASQQFGLSVSQSDLSGLSRLSSTIIIDGSLGTSILDQINNQLGDLSSFIEVFFVNVENDPTTNVDDTVKLGIRPITGVQDDMTFILEDNTTFGFTAGQYSTEQIGTIGVDTTTINTTLNIKVDRKEEYSIIINGKEYFFTCNNNSTYGTVVSNLNSSKTTNDELFKNNFNATFTNGDIKITSLTDEALTVEAGSKDLLAALGITLPAPSSPTTEIERDDRVHHLDFTASQAYQNSIGVRLINANHINFDNVLVYSNTDIGIWQLAQSYSNNFIGEIYDNKNYGVKNTDKKHDFIARQTWWGAITGPSMMGPGEGDKVSSHVIFDNWRQDGNEPEQTFPVTRNWVWRMLGYPLVRVELTEEHVSDAIEMAVERYEEFRVPEQTYYYLPVHTGQQLIELPVWMNKKEVMDVVYSPHADLFSQLTGAGESFYLTYYLQNTGGTFLSDFYVAMAYKETLEMTLGIGPQYELFTQKNADGEWRDYIRLSPKPSVSLQIGVLYNRPMTEEEVDSSDWIRKYALTWAKEQLGRIRSKYASVPGPTGEMQLDGQQLIQEAKEERAALDESVILRGPPLTFDIG